MLGNDGTDLSYHIGNVNSSITTPSLASQGVADGSWVAHNVIDLSKNINDALAPAMSYVNSKINQSINQDIKSALDNQSQQAESDRNNAYSKNIISYLESNSLSNEVRDLDSMKKFGLTYEQSKSEFDNIAKSINPSFSDIDSLMGYYKANKANTADPIVKKINSNPSLFNLLYQKDTIDTKYEQLNNGVLTPDNAQDVYLTAASKYPTKSSAELLDMIYNPNNKAIETDTKVSDKTNALLAMLKKDYGMTNTGGSNGNTSNTNSSNSSTRYSNSQSSISRILNNTNNVTGTNGNTTNDNTTNDNVINDNSINEQEPQENLYNIKDTLLGNDGREGNPLFKSLSPEKQDKIVNILENYRLDEQAKGSAIEKEIKNLFNESMGTNNILNKSNEVIKGLKKTLGNDLDNLDLNNDKQFKYVVDEVTNKVLPNDSNNFFRNDFKEIFENELANGRKNGMHSVAISTVNSLIKLRDKWEGNPGIFGFGKTKGEREMSVENFIKDAKDRGYVKPDTQQFVDMSKNYDKFLTKMNEISSNKLSGTENLRQISSMSNVGNRLNNAILGDPFSVEKVGDYKDFEYSENIKNNALKSEPIRKEISSVYKMARLSGLTDNSAKIIINKIYDTENGIGTGDIKRFKTNSSFNSTINKISNSIIGDDKIDKLGLDNGTSIDSKNNRDKEIIRFLVSSALKLRENFDKYSALPAETLKRLDSVKNTYKDQKDDNIKDNILFNANLNYNEAIINTYKKLAEDFNNDMLANDINYSNKKTK